MADFSFFTKKSKQKIIKIDPEDRRSMEEICEKNGIKFSVDLVKGMYEFSIDEELYPRIEKYFKPPAEEKNPSEKEDPKEQKEEKKAGLDAQIGGAAQRTGGSAGGHDPRPKAPNHTPTQTIPTHSKPSYTPPPQPPKPGFSGRQSTIDKPREPRQTGSFSTPQQPPKVEPKDLTKDFGVLTLEEQQRLDERQAKSEAEKKPKKKRVKTGRDNQVKTRLTDTEMQLFSERVKASGMKQGEFMRECLLHEEVHVRSLTEIDAQAFGKLMEMSSDLGRIGGLIKGTVMINKDEFGVLTPGEKEDLEALIRELNTVKDDLLKVVQTLYGDT